MALEQSADFDIEALYAALDAQRQARGISWQQVVREMNALSERVPARPTISASTLTGMRNRAVIEGDGVLQMLRWLDRTPESFVPGHPVAAEAAKLPDVGPYQILRFDTGRLYAALDAQRRDRGMTWNEVASEIGGFSAAGLTRLSKGGRTGFPHVMRMTRWLRLPAACFMRAFDR